MKNIRNYVINFLLNLEQNKNRKNNKNTQMVIMVIYFFISYLSYILYSALETQIRRWAVDHMVY